MYLENWQFKVGKQQDEEFNYYPILSGIPQGSVLGPTLYVIYTADLPASSDVMMAAFADDTAIIASNEYPK